MAIEVRALTTEDLFTVAKMLSKVAGKSKTQLLAAIKTAGKSKEEGKPEEGESLDPAAFAFDIFKVIIDEVSEDLISWMASLIGVKPAVFKKMPINTPLEIIEVLVKREDLRDFFARVSRLIGGLGGTI
jgi:hypothetical protein